MKSFLLWCSLLVCSASACSQEFTLEPLPADSADLAALLNTSRAAARELLGSLKAVLMREISIGGAAHAVSVCSDSARVIGRGIADVHRVSIRRVSDRWRTREDIPDAFEREVLQRFAASDTLHDRLEHYAVIRAGGTTAFRYLRPIILQPMCLPCHGSAETLRPDVADKLRLLYPEDRATGYTPGQLRGAVSVTIRR